MECAKMKAISTARDGDRIMRRLTAHVISTLSIIVLLSISRWAQPGTITTVVGGYTGDDGLAINASIEVESGN